MEQLINFLPEILRGAWLTLQVALCSLLLSTTIGIFGAFAKIKGGFWTTALLGAYTTIIRGIPELVLMLLIFFGGQVAINQLVFALGSEDYIDLNPFVTGVFTLGIIYGAYMLESFRGALLAIDKGQIEAAVAFGLSPTKVKLRVIIPQMWLHALPAFINNWLVLLKATALVSIIGLNDMVRVASLASGSTKQPFLFYITVSLLFLLFTWVSLFTLRKLSERFMIKDSIEL